jgi:endo-1,4-beta-xylanase
MKSDLTRRAFFHQLAVLGAAGLAMREVRADQGQTASQSPLKAIAKRSGRLVAMFSGQHELKTDFAAAKMIAAEFDMIAIGNDLKMNRIHPQPDIYDFSYGDWDLNWSQRNGLLFRGHTLVWHNALPEWFRSYVNKGNGQRVMTEHITTVMKHYAGKMYAWDVVNEAVRNIDGRPDGLRAWPWLQSVGPDYIEIAFRTAAAADPKAKLFLNENNFEHDLPLHAQRRDTLLQLATRLKKNGTPITGIGIQGHIRADTPLATASVNSLLKEFKDLGLEIMITELDVDDSGIPGPAVDEAVARKYAEYVDMVGPFASVITFEQFADDPSLPKRPDGLIHRPNLFDRNYQKKQAYNAVANSLKSIQGQPVIP